MTGAASEIVGIGACDASVAAAIKARLAFRRALHRCARTHLEIQLNFSLILSILDYLLLQAMVHLPPPPLPPHLPRLSLPPRL
jgi:hypothetical protein